MLEEMFKIKTDPIKLEPIRFIHISADWNDCVTNLSLPKKYIINEKATILFWNNGAVTRSFKSDNDHFDKEIGFMVAFFKFHWGGSKQSQKNVLESINDLKTFMFEYFVSKTGMTKEKARKYLAELVVTENKKKK